MEYRILGPLEIVRDGQALALRGDRQRALLCLLLLSANEVVSSDRLLEDLWGEEQPAAGLKALRVQVSRLRKTLGAALETEGHGYRLRLEPGDLDLERFRALVEEARGQEAKQASETLHEGLSLWRGPPLSDFAYEPWAQAEIGRLQEQRLACLEQRIEADLALGRHGELVAELEPLVAANPLRERLRGQLMLALYRSGRQAEALEAYRRGREALVEGLGIDPSPELQELERAILNQDPALASPPEAASLPSGTVTMLFTDVEGSTGLLQELGAGYAEALAEHRRLLREAFTRHGGLEVDTRGEELFYVFARAADALAAAESGQEALASGPLRVRMGLHTGEPELTANGYVGLDIHKGARVAGAGHGGQVLVSEQTARLLHDAPLRDLGLHRLEGLPTSDRLYQLGEHDFPPLASLYQTNLPAPVTSFVGREREVGEVSALLDRDDVRLVTLTGPGGSGKTRLALQVAAELADRFPDGVWWVPLAPLGDPNTVLETAAQVLGAKQELAEHIGDKRLLLLLDNFEHLTAAAPALADLSLRSRRLSLLVTSREALHVAGEWEYLVDPLRENEAVELFSERASAVDRRFVSTGEVREICLRLDCLPLAIELAAARVKALSPRSILERLEQRLPLLAARGRDAPERQRTLRATIEWSYDLLSSEEQLLLARLAVFSGGCTLEAAEEIAEADLDTLQSLVEKNLVRHAGGRFRMLQTIREFALDRLDAAGARMTLERRHAEHFALFAERIGPELKNEPARWMRRLDLEHPNVIQALEWASESGEVEVELRIVDSFGAYWLDRGHPDEGRRWLEHAVAAGGDRRDEAWAEAVRGAAGLAYYQGDLARAIELAEEDVAFRRGAGDPRELANSLGNLGLALQEVGDGSRSRSAFEECIELARELDDRRILGLNLSSLSLLATQEGAFAEATALAEESIAVSREIGDERRVALGLGNLAAVLSEEGRHSEARDALAECLRLVEKTGLTRYLLWSLSTAAAIAADEGDFRRAARLLGAVQRISEELASAPLRGEAHDRDRAAVPAQRALGEEAFAAAFEEGRSLSEDETLRYALEGLAPAQAPTP